MPAKLPAPASQRHPGSFIQTDRATHEAWARLPSAASQVMHALCACVGEHNAVVINQVQLAEMVGLSPRSVVRAVKYLAENYWIEIRQIGATSAVNAYVINSRVAWYVGRDKLRRSLFSASVLVSETDQPDRQELGKQEPLKQLPRTEETQIPTGPGEPPPSQPSFPGYERDLPARGGGVDLGYPAGIEPDAEAWWQTLGTPDRARAATTAHANGAEIVGHDLRSPGLAVVIWCYLRSDAYRLRADQLSLVGPK